jgi:hypothetical protein
MPCDLELHELPSASAEIAGCFRVCSCDLVVSYYETETTRRLKVWGATSLRVDVAMC